MARDLNVSTLETSIGVTIYMLAITICIPAAAWLADRFGAADLPRINRRLYDHLDCLRFGAGSDIVRPGASAAGRGRRGFVFGRPHHRAADCSEIIVPAIGLTIWPALFAPVIGPALSGFLTEYVSWHWNFWINVPLCTAAFALASRIVPPDHEFKNCPFDAVGFVLTGVTLAALLCGFDALV